MARRSLLTGDERRRLFDLPVDDRGVARHYTLSAGDLKWIEARQKPANQLGAAVQLALLRHPGLGLRAGEAVPSPVLRFLAGQVHAPVTAFADYARRNQTRLEHAGKLQQRLGLRPFAPRRYPICGRDRRRGCLVEADKGSPIAEALMAELRDRRLVLPSPDTLERVGLAGRARARRRRPRTCSRASPPNSSPRRQAPGQRSEPEDDTAGLAARYPGVAQCRWHGGHHRAHSLCPGDRHRPRHRRYDPRTPI